MKFNFTRILLTSSLTLFFSHATAERYIGAQIGQTDLGGDWEDVCSVVNSSAGPGVNTSCDSNVTSFRMYYGHSIKENLGFEVGYQNFGTSRGHANDNIDYLDFKNEITGFDFSGVLKNPISDSTSFVARLGLLFWNVDSSLISSLTGDLTASSSGNSIMFGIGFEFNNFAFTFSKVNSVGDPDETFENDLTTISAGYNFQL